MKKKALIIFLSICLLLMFTPSVTFASSSATTKSLSQITIVLNDGSYDDVKAKIGGEILYHTNDMGSGEGKELNDGTFYDASANSYTIPASVVIFWFKSSSYNCTVQAFRTDVLPSNICYVLDEYHTDGTVHLSFNNISLSESGILLKLDNNYGKYTSTYGTIEYSEDNTTWTKLSGATYSENDKGYFFNKDVEYVRVNKTAAAQYDFSLIDSSGSQIMANNQSYKLSKGTTYNIEYPYHTVEYILNGGSNPNTISNYVTGINTLPIDLKNPVKKGYSGTWYHKGDSKGNVISQIKKGDGDVVLCANWIAHKYKIKFDGHGSTSGKMPTMTSLKYGTKYNLKANTFKKKGHAFKYWTTKKDGKGTKYKNKASVKNLTSVNGKTITLFAQWK